MSKLNTLGQRILEASVEREYFRLDVAALLEDENVINSYSQGDLERFDREGNRSNVMAQYTKASEIVEDWVCDDYVTFYYKRAEYYLYLLD